ncbi:16S rRNA (guanine(527)-N(7))-methyltransferase RsmG [Kribbia dieselivorans]|uniref:16S rRNA (guanine(527)-N(7))-methyltransferase RsmG n=1 Tax=Kribbia dieselivorans TaxID=331526 RepID=UPI001FDF753F|nr:16S rRNA (guanine(527)-N(7))-methyltransferase RsmG [Kribbia dieselivorans]
MSVPGPPGSAVAVFGDRLGIAERFTAILADTGVSHGLIGPREVPRLWDRHVLNCAVVAPALPDGVRLIDVGSGAGLPGVALAIARADLEVHLIEPMLRRTQWLSSTVEELGLGNVTVHRGRAEEFHGSLTASWVTARAVARIDKLARWCFPLLEPHGTLIALKGRSAESELDEERATLTGLGMESGRVRQWGAGIVDEPTWTMELTVGSLQGGRPGHRAGRASAAKAGRGGSSRARRSGGGASASGRKRPGTD